jgi:peptidoglycan/LPS O-acetylase OafA/YrhL
MDRVREAGGGAVLQAGERRSGRIESLRAVAALAVLTSHGLLAGGGYSDRLSRTLAFGGSLGVFLFFALTGYLLFLPFARRFSGDGRPIDLGRYALNRAVRVLPLYYVVLVVFLLVNEQGGTATQWWRFATFSQSFFSDTVSTVDGPMWSLVVEIEFYALLPLLAWGVGRAARGSRGVAAATIVALGLASGVVWWLKVGSVGGSDLRWKYSLPATFFNFTPGMLLALLRLELNERRPAWLPSAGMLLAAGALVWAAAADQLTYPQPLAAAAAFLVVGAVVLPVGRRPARAAARCPRARHSRDRLVQPLPLALPDRGVTRAPARRRARRRGIRGFRGLHTDRPRQLRADRASLPPPAPPLGADRRDARDR